MKKGKRYSSGTDNISAPVKKRSRQSLLQSYICFLLCFCMAMSIVPLDALAANTNEEKHPFTDVPADSWYNDSVQYVYENGIFSGTEADKFTPDGDVTRGMFMTVLGRMAGADTAAYEGQSTFGDVAKDAYYAPYVAWAVDNGVTSGTGEDTFSPDKLISREEMATLFARYFKAFNVSYDALANNTEPPADLDDISDWAKEFVLILWTDGLMVGTDKGFDPKADATRAQAATLCMRIHKALKKQGDETPGTTPAATSDATPSATVSVVPTATATTSGGSGHGSSRTQYYEVKFALGSGQDASGIKLPETATLRSGTKISELTTPYQFGKVFLGWYYDSEMTNAAKTSDVVDKNMTLYARMGELDEVSAEETPNYLTKTDVGTDFTFYVKGDSEEDVKAALTVTQITASNTVLVWNEDNGLTITKDGDYYKITGTYKEGQTYKAELDESSDVQFVVDGEVQPESVQDLNFITAKQEVMNLKLRDGLIYLPKADVDYGENTPLAGLFVADAMDGVASGGEIKSVENVGSFSYSGDKTINVGDTIAIYEGTEPDKRTLDTGDDGTVVYVKVTAVKGEKIDYETADSMDILFTPDVLPVQDANADESGSVTLSGDALNFAKYEVPGLDNDTTIDVGDYLAFYTGDFDENTGEVTNYACVTGVSKDGAAYNINYKKATEAEMMSAMDIYSTRQKDIKLTEEEQAQVISDIERQVSESGYAETAIDTLSQLAWESEDLDDLNSKLENMGSGISFSLDAEKTDGDGKSDKDKKKNADIFNALKDLKKNTQWKHKVGEDAKIEAKFLPYTKTHFNKPGCFGLGVSFEYEVKTPLNESGKNELTFKVNAELELDFMLSLNTTGGAVWKKKWIFPYIADYQLNANLDAGVYTGLSLAFTLNTGEKEDDDDDDDDEEEEEKKEEDKLMFMGADWSFLWGDIDEDDDDEDDEYHGIIALYAERLGKKIDEMKEDSEDFLSDDDDDDDEDDNDNEDEDEDEDKLEAMREQYADLIEEADDAWITLAERELVSWDGAIDPLHILCYGISVTAVFKANAYATLGATAEYSHSKRLTFSMLLSEKKGTSDCTELESRNCGFTFYLMGTMGLRAGVEIELAGGLCSLKIDSVGFTAEFGFYATACGYVYATIGWEEGKGWDTARAGAFHSEVGAYITLGWNVKLLNSKSLTYEQTLIDKQWPFLTFGENENVYSFDYLLLDKDEYTPADNEEVGDDGPVYTLENAKTLTLPTTLFDMSYMKMQTGELYGAEGEEDDDDDDEDEDKKDEDEGEKEKEHPAKNYDDETESRFDISLSNDKFSYDPKTDTITVTPDGSVEESCDMTITWKGNSIAFSSEPISMTVTINWSDDENARYIAFDSQGGSTAAAIARTAGASVETPASPTKQGYDFAGWYEDEECTKPFTVPSTMPDYSNEDKGVTVYAKWTPRTDTPYKIEYYDQGTNGTYSLSKSEWNIAQTDSTVPADIITSKTGYNYNSKKSTADQTVAANNSTVVKLYYDRQKYNLTFDYGTDDSEKMTSQVRYGTEISEPQVNKAGYTFAGWDKAIADTMPAEDVTYTAQWTANTDTAYKVNHYKQDENGGYTLTDTDELTGTTDTETKAEAKDYIGYAVKDFEQKNIDGKGNTVVNVYYDIAENIVTFKNGDEVVGAQTVKYNEKLTAPETPSKTGYTFGGWVNADGTAWDFENDTVTEALTLTAKWTANDYTVTFKNGDDVKTQTVKYGEKPTEPTEPEKTGYTFGGWLKSDGTAWNFANDIVTGDLELTAKWTANANTAYKVNHYKQEDVNGKYNLADTDNLTGTTNTETKAEAKTYDGYTVKDFEQKTIAADGTTAVDIYYDINAYTVTFMNGDSLVGVKTVGYGKTVEAMTEPAKTGYTFGGWLKSDGTAWDFEKDTVTDNVTLTANWTAKEYTVTFKNGETTVDTKTVKYGETVTAPTEPEKTGYTFAGWLNGNTAWDFEKNTVTDNVTLSAKWTAIDYKINYAGVENKTAYTVTSFTVEGLDAFTLTAPTKTGYEFNGWTCDNSKVTISGNDVTIPNGIANNITITANWTINKYTVTFVNDGSEYDTKTVDYNSTVTAPETEPTKTGYTFAGWMNGNTEWNFDSDTVTEDLTLTAKWTINQYTVTFISDDTQVDKKTVDYNSTVTAPETEPTKTGYTFAGWMNGNTEWNFDSDTVTDNLTLTAKWTAKEYTVTFKNGETTVDTKTVKYGETVTAPTEPKKDGYNFDGWVKSDNTAWTFASDTVTENITLTAKWTAIDYKIIYAGVADDSAYTVTSFTVEGLDKFTLTAPTKTGYEFNGWTCDNSKVTFSGNDVTIPNGIANNITIAANWTINKYTVTFVNDGSEYDTKTVDYNSIVEAPTEPSKTGYTFGGWVDSNDKAWTFASDKVTENVTLTAKWTINQYTVTFMSDGTEFTKQQGVDYNSKITAPETEPTKTGYTFAGWMNGNTEWNFDSDTVTDNLTLTAKWTAKEYTVTFKNGETTVDTKTVKYGETVTAPTEPKKDGYNFDGWVKSDNTAWTFASDTVTENITLTAKWTAIDYKIIYAGVADDSAYTVTSFTVEGLDEFELTAPTKTGYTFDKWSCDNDKVKIDGNKVTISSGITENIMITAKWKSNGTKLLDPNGKDIGTFKTDDSLSYTISYDNSGEAVADAIVAYWLGSDSNHYYDGNTVTADVETLQAVLMTEETPMEINSIVQMTKLAEMVSAVATATDTDPNEDYDADADADTNASKWVSGYYKLVSDLSLDSNWNGIGTADSSFTGSFDGNGETITYANATHSLFNNTSGATIKKLTVMGELNGTDAFVGGIVGSANDTNISDVNLSGVKISGSSDSQCYVGGIAGSTNGGTITAETNGYGMINGCVITATVSQSSASAWSGGVVGTAMHTNISKLNVSGGKITATGSEIYGSICVGGAVGVYNADSSGCSINTVNVSGVSISATGKENTDTCAGGIIGNALIFGGNITVKNCSVAGLPDCKAEATGSIANVNSAGIIGLLLYGSSTSVMIEQPMVNSSSFTAANSTEDCDPAIVATVVGKIVSTTSGSIVISGYITNEVTLSGTTGDTVHKLYGELPDGENVEDDSDNQKLTITFNP